MSHFNFILKPFGFGAECLKPITLNPSAPRITIGRNEQTLVSTSLSDMALLPAFKYLTYLPRNGLVSVSYESCGSLLIRSMQPVSSTRLNKVLLTSYNETGGQKIVHGDIINLVWRPQIAGESSSSGDSKWDGFVFNYEVIATEALPLSTKPETASSTPVIGLEKEIIEIVDTATNHVPSTPSTVDIAPSRGQDIEIIEIVDTAISRESSTNSATLSTSAPISKASSTMFTLIERELECNICSEPVAFTHSLPVCGHSFCYECIIDWFKVKEFCPSCHEKCNVAALVPNRLADNIIRGILTSDEFQHYEERVSAGVNRKKHSASSNANVGSSSSAASINATIRPYLAALPQRSAAIHREAKKARLISPNDEVITIDD